MSRILLINTAEEEETRAALVAEGKLVEFRREPARATKLLGNIYKGRVVNIEPGIEAAFLDIGTGRNAFLHVTDCVGALEAGAAGRARPRIADHARLGQDLVVQVTREPIGSKGPVVTGHLSLAGRFLVLLPRAAAGGVSRRIEETEGRAQLRQVARELEERAGMGLIVRTAAGDRTRRELLRDLTTLRSLWDAISREAETRRAPARLHVESDLVVRALRDLLDRDVEEVHVDTPEARAAAQRTLEALQPELVARLRLHEGHTPLFHRFGIEEEIDCLRRRAVPLPGGGSVVFDATEALVAVDVNSGRTRNDEGLEETALRTNIEAAAEIARQLRLRDLGGVIVVDFIDLQEVANVRAVEKQFRLHLKQDRARVRTGRMGAFGVYVLTRRRAGAGQVSEERPCPRCGGTGRAHAPDEIALRVFRELRARAARSRGGGLTARVSPEVGALLRESRAGALDALASEAGLELKVADDPSLPPNGWAIQRGSVA